MNKTTLNSQKEKHSMLSLRRATFRRQRARRGPQHFYPRSPCGERRCQTLSDCRYTAISIHALLAESDFYYFTLHVLSQTLFLSTLSLRRATEHLKVHLKLHCISIHALLAESDVKNSPALLSNDQFLSTLSLRRATFARQVQCIILRNFYPRSPCGERPPFLLCHDLARDISIHALLAESDVSRYMDLVAVYHNFYPRSPCRERHWQQ